MAVVAFATPRPVVSIRNVGEDRIKKDSDTAAHNRLPVAKETSAAT